MSCCVLAGLEVLAVLTAGLADELDPVGEFARFASKLGLIVFTVVLLSGYFIRRRQTAAARAKSRRKRHRGRQHSDETRLANLPQLNNKSTSNSAADL